jgi:hypothetical protein
VSKAARILASVNFRTKELTLSIVHRDRRISELGFCRVRKGPWLTNTDLALT